VPAAAAGENDRQATTDAAEAAVNARAGPRLSAGHSRRTSTTNTAAAVATLSSAGSLIPMTAASG
jgi:hypothetical protein